MTVAPTGRRDGLAPIPLAAVQADRFLARTHPEAADTLGERGADLDGFVQGQTIEVGGP